MTDFHKFFAATLLARRANKLSLTVSYRLAADIVKLPRGSDESMVLLQSAVAGILSTIEADGQEKAKAGVEPAYHNRQHIADATLAMACFLSEDAFLTAYEKQLLLLVMLVHDFGHCGIANKKPDLSHEEESIELLKATPLMLLPQQDIDLIHRCILGTSPNEVIEVDKQFRSKPSDHYFYMRALVNDADIASSFISPLDLELTKLILLEKGNVAPSKEEVRSMLKAFQSHAVISTPIAKKALGL